MCTDVLTRTQEEAVRHIIIHYQDGAIYRVEGNLAGIEIEFRDYDVENYAPEDTARLTDGECAVFRYGGEAEMDEV